MFERGLMALTEIVKSKDAWETLFSSYVEGDIVAIKLNFNDLYREFKGLVTSPALINSIVSGLKKHLGVERPANYGI